MQENILMETRTYEKAIQIVVGKWMEETFWDKYKYELPDKSGLLYKTKWFKEADVDSKIKIDFINRSSSTTQMLDFKKRLIDFLNQFKDVSDKESKTDLYVDNYNPQGALADIVDETGFNSVLLPNKMHTKINTKNQVLIRIGHYLGDSAYQ